MALRKIICDLQVFRLKLEAQGNDCNIHKIHTNNKKSKLFYHLRHKTAEKSIRS